MADVNRNVLAPSGRLLADMLFGVRPDDPLTLVIVAAGLGAV